MKSSMNLADEVQTLLTLMTTESEDFVQAVNVQLRRSPSVVLYTQDQIQDIRSLCSPNTLPELRSVLAFDRTFNLSSLYVTVMVFKQRKVVRKSSQEPPIFIGPMLLHGDGKFSTYLNFFSHVNGALNGVGVSASEFRMLDNVITGSDDENALVNAAKTAFHNSPQLFCMLHVKDNVRHKLTSIGTDTTTREQIIARLFGSTSVAESSTEGEQDDRVAELMQYVRQQNVECIEYLKDRVLPKIMNNYAVRQTEAWIGQRQWTNNNCESANHVLKVQVDWKPNRVTDLIGHLRSVVRQQYTELRRSLAGLGDLQLTPSFAARHLTTQMRWNSMTDTGKDRAFAKFMADTGVTTVKTTVTSTDENLTVVGSPRIARKKSQQRRARAERTSRKKI